MYTYIHTYIHACIYTDIQASTHTYMHMYIHTYIHKYIRTYIHTYIRTYINTYIYIYTHTHLYVNAASHHHSATTYYSSTNIRKKEHLWQFNIPTKLAHNKRCTKENGYSKRQIQGASRPVEEPVRQHSNRNPSARPVQHLGGTIWEFYISQRPCETAC